MNQHVELMNPAASFPVTEAQGIEGSAAMPYNGRWRLLDSSNYALPPDEPGLDQVATEVRGGYLVLRAPGMLRLDIPLDVLEDDPSVLETVVLDEEAVQVADEAAWAHAWFSQVLGQPVRLVKVCAA